MRHLPHLWTPDGHRLRTDGRPRTCRRCGAQVIAIKVTGQLVPLATDHGLFPARATTLWGLKYIDPYGVVRLVWRMLPCEGRRP